MARAATAIATKPTSRREITLTRMFDAPRPLVYRMWTEAKHLAQWFGPHTFTNPVCEVDARPGGKIFIKMQAPNGDTHPMGGTFHEVVPNERLVFTSFVEMDAILGDRTNAMFGKAVDFAVKHYADDVVSYYLAPPLQHVGANKAAVQAWFDTWDGPISWVVHDLHVETGGDVAYAH